MDLTLVNSLLFGMFDITLDMLYDKLLDTRYKSFSAYHYYCYHSCKSLLNSLYDALKLV